MSKQILQQFEDEDWKDEVDGILPPGVQLQSHTQQQIKDAIKAVLKAKSNDGAS